MQLMEMMRNGVGAGPAHGPTDAFAALAAAFDVAPEQIERAAGAVLPAVTQGIERASLSRGGLAEVVRLLGAAGQQTAHIDPSQLQTPEMTALGVDVLDRVFGSKDRSRAVAARASQASGLSEALIKQMLPYIVTMAMGAIAKSASGGLGSILGQLPGQMAGQRPAMAPQFPSSAGSGGPLALPSGPPSSLGGSSPYGDIADILTKRGPAAGAGAPSAGQTAGMLRQLLGSLLGFSTRGGVMGWIIRAVVLRYGWTLVRTLLSRVLLGR
jgi:hypothetical protein